jgi:hypothetical protein
VTGIVIQLTMVGMAPKPGRRIGTPSEFRDALMERVRAGREKLGWDFPKMAEELSRRVGRPISAGTYRKWESEAMIPHDVILPFCDLIAVHPFEFLAQPPFEQPQKLQVHRSNPAA